MVTLNELIEVTDVEEMIVYFQMSDNIKPRMDFPTRGDRFDELKRMFGACPVKRVSASFRGDPRMVVEIDPKGPPCDVKELINPA